MTMARRKVESPKRNAVAVRFADDELALIAGEAERAAVEVSPWVRDAAVEKARRRAARRTGDDAETP
jgi:hypothetical protein